MLFLNNFYKQLMIDLKLLEIKLFQYFVVMEIYLPSIVV